MYSAPGRACRRPTRPPSRRPRPLTCRKCRPRRSRLSPSRRAQRGASTHVTPEVLVKRIDLGGLPLRMGLECQLGKESAENLQVLSRKLRTYVTASVPQDGIDTRPDPLILRAKMMEGPDAAR